MHPPRGDSKIARRYQNLAQKPQQPDEESQHCRDEEQRDGN
jgi:hypothetical protein